LKLLCHPERRTGFAKSEAHPQSKDPSHLIGTRWPRRASPPLLSLIFVGTGTDAVDGGSSMMVDIAGWPIPDASCPRLRERGCPSFAALAKLGTTDPDPADPITRHFEPSAVRAGRPDPATKPGFRYT